MTNYVSNLGLLRGFVLCAISLTMKITQINVLDQVIILTMLFIIVMPALFRDAIVDTISTIMLVIKSISPRILAVKMDISKMDNLYVVSVIRDIVFMMIFKSFQIQNLVLKHSLKIVQWSIVTLVIVLRIVEDVSKTMLSKRILEVKTNVYKVLIIVQ